MEACLWPQVSWRFINDNHQADNKRGQSKECGIVYNSARVGYICVLLCADVEAMYSVCVCVCACMKIYAACNKFVVIFWMYETRYVAKKLQWIDQEKIYIAFDLSQTHEVRWWQPTHTHTIFINSAQYLIEQT